MDSGIPSGARRKYPSGPARNKSRSLGARKTYFALCALHPGRLDFDNHVSGDPGANTGLHEQVRSATNIKKQNEDNQRIGPSKAWCESGFYKTASH